MKDALMDKNLTRISYQLLFLILALILMLGDRSFAACKASRDPKFNYFVSYESKSLGIFGEGSTLNWAPTTIERCKEDAGQFLMISLGVRRANLYSDTSDVSFDGQLSDTQCRVENSFLKNTPDFAENKTFLNKQYQALRACTYIQIYDLDDKPLEFKPQQDRCQVTPMQGHVYRAEGDYCFFRIRPTSRFAISTIIKPECSDETYLKAHHINPQDIEAALNTYVVGDDSGHSEEVNPIGSSRVRVYIAPHSSQLPMTEDDGPETPRFPTDYPVEIHMGDMKIRGSKDNYVMDMSLLVNNRAARICKNSFCTSASDFDLPVVGDVELEEIQGDRHVFIDEWWHAGLVPARWQGLVKSDQHNLNEVEFKAGSRYSLSVTFIDPYDDFSLYLKGMEQLVIDLQQLQGTAGLDSISPLPSLTALVGTPNLENLPALRSPDMSAEMNRILETLRHLGQDRQWPTYYDRICDTNRASCIKAGKAKYFLKLTTEFTVAGQNAADYKLEFKDITVKRDSPQFESYNKKVKALPKVVCGENL